MDKGLTHIYCGDVKGKTTAALGLAIRAAGNNYNVVIVQFMKTWNSSELSTLNSIENISLLRGKLPSGFSWDLNDEQKNIILSEHNRIFKEAISKCNDLGKMLLIFDELIGSYNKNFIDREMVLEFIKNKPDNLEVVLTGRNPSNELLELADYISEIKKVKHPYDKGISARKGIEF